MNQHKYMQQIMWQTFKTQPCKKCITFSPLLINFMCPYYHSKIDMRRNPFDQNYSALYLQDDMDPKHCLNIVQYLYHPNNYRRNKCQSKDCKKEYFTCPNYHTTKQILAKVEVADDYTNVLSQLDNLLFKISQAENKQQENKANSLEQFQSNLKDISSINQQKSQVLQYKQTQFYYQFSQVKFHEDRHHEFKHFQQLNYNHHIPLIFEYMCAFINAQGGTLYIGIDDSGMVKGIRLTNKDIDKVLLQIDNGCKMRVNPPLLPQKYKVDFVKVKNQRTYAYMNQIYVIQIHVDKSSNDTPYLFNRQYYLRMNASTHRLLAAQIIERQKLKYQQKLSKGIEFQRAVINNERKYFDKMTIDELLVIKDKLNSTTQYLSQAISSRNI